jgi:hypothetical protein
MRSSSNGLTQLGEQAVGGVEVVGHPRATPMVPRDRRHDTRIDRARSSERELPVEPRDGGPQHHARDGCRQREQGPERGIALHDVEQPRHLETGRRYARDAHQPVAVALGQTERDAATERVADGQHRLSWTPGRVSDSREREFVELGQDRLGLQAVGRAKAREVDRDRAVALTRE